MRITLEAVGHTFDIHPGDQIALGQDDGTFAIRWGDGSIYTYRATEGYDDGSLNVVNIEASDCTADLSSFLPLFSDRFDDDYSDGEDDAWDDDDGLSDGEADAMTLASCGWGTDEDYGFYGGDEW